MNNTYGTHVMLEAARMTGTIQRFINVSTDEVYGETSLGEETGERGSRGAQAVLAGGCLGAGVAKALEAGTCRSSDGGWSRA
jgi:nucleoside-diphosphate-sugar epimerase